MKTLLQRWFPLTTAHRSLSAVAAEPWLVRPEALLGAFEEIAVQAQVFNSAQDIRDAMAAVERDSQNRRPYAVEDGVAFIPIHGLIMKDVPCAFRLFGTPATSTLETEAILAQALADNDVQAIFLDIDSPGGTLSGTAALADAVYEANQSKPVHGYASDLAASAAYWIGAQASRLTSGRTAEIGSIGVYKLLVDRSKKAQAEGLTIHRLASGPHKGAGAPGAPITEDQLKVEQELIDKAAELFRQSVLRGRPNLAEEQLKNLATGRVWFGQEAKDLGLVDDIQSAQQAFEDTRAAGSRAFETEPEQGSKASQGGGNRMMWNRQSDATQEISALEERVAELDAKNEELTQALATSNKERDAAIERATQAEATRDELKEKIIQSMLDKHQAAGRFDASARPAMEQRAAKFGDIDELDTLLSETGTRDKRQPTGAVGAQAPSEAPEAWQSIDMFTGKYTDASGQTHSIQD